jgi:YVTN family beta-propeller protein
MNRFRCLMPLLAGAVLASSLPALAGQAPGAASDPDVPVSHRDRVYAAEQFSNTVSVTDPADNKLLGVIRLGDPQPGNLSPLYRGQVLVHGMGFSPDHRTIAVVSIGSNSVTFIDTATNAVKHVTYVGRSPHEAFFTPDGKEVWVTVRGEDYIAVLDGRTYEETSPIKVPAGPGMQIFSPDGKYGYVCSSFNPETVVITVADHQIVGRVKQESPFCPNIAATPDGWWRHLMARPCSSCTTMITACAWSYSAARWRSARTRRWRRIRMGRSGASPGRTRESVTAWSGRPRRKSSTRSPMRCAGRSPPASSRHPRARSRPGHRPAPPRRARHPPSPGGAPGWSGSPWPRQVARWIFRPLPPACALDRGAPVSWHPRALRVAPSLLFQIARVSSMSPKFRSTDGLSRGLT